MVKRPVCSRSTLRACKPFALAELLGSLSSALRFVFRKTGLKSDLSERIRAIVPILQNGGQIVGDLIETRCHRGADIAAKMRVSAAVQDGIRSLDKPGKLDDAEWSAVRSHPQASETILARVSAFADIASVAGAHHERLDGKGYPRGLKGDEVCLEARILNVADVFDALTAARPYRARLPIAEALAILGRETGSAFDLAASRRSRQAFPASMQRWQRKAARRAGCDGRQQIWVSCRSPFEDCGTRSLLGAWRPDLADKA